jgi:hypothetical protein
MDSSIDGRRSRLCPGSRYCPQPDGGPSPPSRKRGRAREGDVSDSNRSDGPRVAKHTGRTTPAPIRVAERARLPVASGNISPSKEETADAMDPVDDVE